MEVSETFDWTRDALIGWRSRVQSPDAVPVSVDKIELMPVSTS